VGRVAGIDWAKDEHHVLVCDERGVELYEEVVAHEEEQLAGLCATLRRLRVERIAVERPDGLLVEPGDGKSALSDQTADVARGTRPSVGGGSGAALFASKSSPRDAR
jgi:Transposase